MKVSLIMPAYNEEDMIEQSITHVERMMESLGLDYELVVVDDGSTDRTFDRAKHIEQPPYVKVVGYKQNRGKGYAVKTGFEHSTGDAIIFIDADMEIAPRDFEMYFKALEEADIAIGSRWHHQSRVEAPIMRRLLSLAFHILAKLTTGMSVSDTQAGFKAFRREALARIVKLGLVKRYAFDVELLALASLLKLKVRELPVEMEQSAMFSLKTVRSMFIELMGIVYKLRIIRWYQRNLNSEKPVYKPLLPEDRI